MKRKDIAKLFITGRSQAVRLPKEFRFEGDQVRIRRVGTGVLLESIETDTSKLFQEIDAVDETFMAGGRQQPDAPIEDLFPE